MSQTYACGIHPRRKLAVEDWMDEASTRSRPGNTAGLLPCRCSAFKLQGMQAWPHEGFESKGLRR